MSDPIFFLPTLRLNVDFWCHGVTESTGVAKSLQKTKLVSAHPHLPLILSQDDQNHINLWDYAQQKCLWQASAATLAKEIVFLEQNFRDRTPNKSVLLSRVNRPLSGTAHTPRGLPTAAALRNASREISPTDLRNVKDHFGDLQCADFADSSYLFAQGALHTPTDQLPASTTHRITLLYENSVVIYDYSRNKAIQIIRTAEQLQNKKPVSFTWLSLSHCAIGCADGVLRIWNTTEQRITQIVSLCNRGEIASLRILAAQPDTSMHSTSLTLCSIGGDNIVLFWQLSLIPADQNAAHVLIENQSQTANNNANNNQSQNAPPLFKSTATRYVFTGFDRPSVRLAEPIQNTITKHLGLHPSFWTIDTRTQTLQLVVSEALGRVYDLTALLPYSASSPPSGGNLGGSHHASSSMLDTASVTGSGRNHNNSNTATGNSANGGAGLSKRLSWTSSNHNISPHNATNASNTTHGTKSGRKSFFGALTRRNSNSNQSTTSSNNNSALGNASVRCGGTVNELTCFFV